jgi:hypothetical protein
MKVIRILIYEGAENWIETTLAGSYIKKDAPFNAVRGTITEEFLLKKGETDGKKEYCFNW